MKNIQLGRIFQIWLQNGNRFPFASFVAHLGALCAVSLIFWRHTTPNEEQVGAVLMACIVVFPLAILAQAVFSQDRTRNLIAHAVLIAAGIGIAFLLNNRLDYANDWAAKSFFLLAAASHLLFSSLAFLGDKDSHNFWEFNRQALAQLFTGLLFSFALWAGVGAAILAVDKLFELNIDGEVYGTWSVLSWALMSTGYFMAQFPTDLDFSKEEMVFDRAYLTLTKYLFIPITLLYFVILYAYGLKIAMRWELPHGWVAGLCIGFSLAGVITWLLNYFLPNWYESVLLAWFKRWFWVLTVPVIALLVVAIGRRISDYGITEERYIVAMIAGCFLVNMLYYALVPRPRQRLWFLPMTVAVAAIVTAFGPLNARDVSIRNQKKQLVRMLTDAGLYENGAVRVPTQEVQVPGILLDKIDFLASRDSAVLSQTLNLDPATRQQLETEHGGALSGYTLSKTLKMNSLDNTDPNGQNYFNFTNLAYHEAYRLPAGVAYRLKPPVQTDPTGSNVYDSGYQLEHTINFAQLYLRENGQRIDSFDLRPVQPLLSEIGIQAEQGYYADTLAPIILQGTKYRVACIPESLNGDKIGSKYQLAYLSGDYYLIVE